MKVLQPSVWLEWGTTSANKCTATTTGGGGLLILLFPLPITLHCSFSRSTKLTPPHHQEVTVTTHADADADADAGGELDNDDNNDEGSDNNTTTATATAADKTRDRNREMKKEEEEEDEEDAEEDPTASYDLIAVKHGWLVLLPLLLGLPIYYLKFYKYKSW
jgi:hypothetical protein